MKIGGPISKSSVTLRISGEALVPSEVSSLMGTTPTHAHARGDRTSPRVANPRKSGMWMLEVSEASGDLEKQLNLLLDQIPSTTAWKTIRHAYAADIVCTVTVTSEHEGFSISSGTTMRVAAAGIDLSFGVWTDFEGQAESGGVAD